MVWFSSMPCIRWRENDHHPFLISPNTPHTHTRITDTNTQGRAPRVMLCTETETDCLIKCKLVSRQMRIYPHTYIQANLVLHAPIVLNSYFFAVLFGSLDTRILYYTPRRVVSLSLSLVLLCTILWEARASERASDVATRNVAKETLFWLHLHLHRHRRRRCRLIHINLIGQIVYGDFRNCVRTKKVIRIVDYYYGPTLIGYGL